MSVDPSAWFALPVLVGDLVRLEPLTVEHAEGYFTAANAGTTAGDTGAGQEVFRWLRLLAPRTVAEAAQQVTAAVADRAGAVRLPYAQIDVATGRFIGTTSLYDIVPDLRTLAIGYTWLGRPWWRTGHNRDAKRLLLDDAFGRLGAVRVVWHTDIRNERSQRAIERLGAVREGVLRKHLLRLDGSWRDTVTYAMTDDDRAGRADQRPVNTDP